MDVSRFVRGATGQGADTLDRAAMEGDPFQQGHPSVAVGDVSKSPQSAAGLFRGRSERSKARHLLCPQAALFARGRQYRAGQRRYHVGGAARTVWRRGFYSPGLRAAAQVFGSVSGARKLAGRPYAVRTIDPRGRESDHRQYIAVLAARDSLKAKSTCNAASVETRR